MSKLFNDLFEEGLFDKWAGILDWLFDDNRFSVEYGWTKGYVGSFIKRVKRMSNLKKDNYSYEPISKLEFPTQRKNAIIIMHSKGGGESKDLIRHIRNGIAHGKTKLFKKKGELWIEIYDYKTNGEQSAYMCMPLESMYKIYDIYCDVKNRKNNNRSIYYGK